MSEHFTTEIVHPETERIVTVEVEYEIKDLGVMGRKNERMGAVLLGVKAGDEELVDQIDNDLHLHLAGMAYAHDEGMADFNREAKGGNDDESFL